MVQLYKHPILMKCYDVTMKIEACGGSPELTTAVIASSALMEEVEKLVDESEKRRQASENIWHSVMNVYGPEGFTKVISDMEKRKREYNLTPEMDLIRKLQLCNEEFQSLIKDLSPETTHSDLVHHAVEILNKFKV